MSVGTDIIDLEEFELKLVSGGESFWRRNYSMLELKDKSTIHLAGLFSVKEAIFKTGFLKAMDFKAIQIINSDSGKPEVYDRGGRKIDCLSVSISHTSKTVISVAIWT